MSILKRTLLSFTFLAVFLAGCVSAPEAHPTVPPTSAPTSTRTLPASPTAEPTPTAIRLTDGTGTDIALPGPAAHIVSLGPSNTEILFALGAQN